MSVLLCVFFRFDIACICICVHANAMGCFVHVCLCANIMQRFVRTCVTRCAFCVADPDLKVNCCEAQDASVSQMSQGNMGKHPR